MRAGLTDQQIVKVEKALNIKLYDWQHKILQASDTDNRTLPSGRGNGKTLIYCVDLAMTEGIPIKVQDIWKYSDSYGRYGGQYDEHFFKDMFLDIWSKLRNEGLPVRHIVIKIKGNNGFINKDFKY
ncbi:hypothetical protein [Clostridium estertheticum]|uniref:hypothetical protein n=1 Tax=Clostridium estertheticum TaxID=238834 RepID=UPI001C6E2CE3|nr:hypothetical protein [Clostridium estertheticum]MBW9154297.1 hypothetical protein [Clostridium estertheticum]WLC86670.1 hypothetical protein KTC97_22135 [Clostridium estertheticum]